jgi:hypothetical protein
MVKVINGDRPLLLAVLTMLAMLRRGRVLRVHDVARVPSSRVIFDVCAFL